MVLDHEHVTKRPFVEHEDPTHMAMGIFHHSLGWLLGESSNRRLQILAFTTFQVGWCCGRHPIQGPTNWLNITNQDFTNGWRIDASNPGEKPFSLGFFSHIFLWIQLSKADVKRKTCEYYCCNQWLEVVTILYQLQWCHSNIYQSNQSIMKAE